MKTTIQWLDVTDELKGGRRVHQSSALLAVVMDRLIHMVRQESLWAMMFADNIVFCSPS